MQQEITPCRSDDEIICKDASLPVAFDRYPGNVPYGTNKMTEVLNRRYSEAGSLLDKCGQEIGENYAIYVNGNPYHASCMTPRAS